MTVPEYTAHNESGCARTEIYHRSRRLRDPIYRSRIAPILIPGLSRPLRVSVCTAASSVISTADTAPLATSRNQNTALPHRVMEDLAARDSLLPSSSSFSLTGRNANVSARATFFVSDSVSNNLPMALRFRQMPELARRRLRVNKSLIHGWGIFAIEVAEWGPIFCAS